MSVSEILLGYVIFMSINLYINIVIYKYICYKYNYKIHIYYWLYYIYI